MSRIIVTMLTLCLIAGCSMPHWVYRKDLHQGSRIEQEALDKLAIGLTQEEVIGLLGTPTLTDRYSPDRWDYLTVTKPGFAEAKRAYLQIWFDASGKVARFHTEQAAHFTPNAD